MARHVTVALAVVPDADPRPRPVPGRPAARGLLIGGALTALGLLVVGLGLHLTVLSRLSEGRDQQVLRAQLQKEIRAGAVPLVEGEPALLLQVPRLGVDAVVVEGTSSADLAHGPGHRRSTPLPGQAGLAVVTGRRTAYGGPFAHLGRLRVGDRLVTTTVFGRAVFRVDDIRHDGAPVSLPPGDARLQLVTSDPAWTPDRVLVVSSVMVEGALQPAAHGLPRPTRQELALQGDPRAALPLALWAAALLVLSVALTWAWLRLPRSVVWVGGAPAALLVIWQLFDAAARLLPSTL